MGSNGKPPHTVFDFGRSLQNRHITFSSFIDAESIKRLLLNGRPARRAVPLEERRQGELWSSDVGDRMTVMSPQAYKRIEGLIDIEPGTIVDTLETRFGLVNTPQSAVVPEIAKQASFRRMSLGDDDES